MFIWGYCLCVIVYVYATVVAKSGVIIKFYAVASCYQDPIQIETLEEENSPVTEDKSEMEDAPISLLLLLQIFSQHEVHCHPRLYGSFPLPHSNFQEKVGGN